jgi:hypothetical protein
LLSSFSNIVVLLSQAENGANIVGYFGAGPCAVSFGVGFNGLKEKMSSHGPWIYTLPKCDAYANE